MYIHNVEVYIGFLVDDEHPLRLNGARDILAITIYNGNSRKIKTFDELCEAIDNSTRTSLIRSSVCPFINRDYTSLRYAPISVTATKLPTSTVDGNIIVNSYLNITWRCISANIGLWDDNIGRETSQYLYDASKNIKTIICHLSNTLQDIHPIIDHMVEI